MTSKVDINENWETPEIDESVSLLAGELLVSEVGH